MADEQKPAARLIVSIVKPSKAKEIAQRFLKGDTTLALAQYYSLSRTGVEDLIREFGISRRRRVAR